MVDTLISQVGQMIGTLLGGGTALMVAFGLGLLAVVVRAAHKGS